MNVVLEWSTGSDLDIQVRCGCDKWHGYGTEGGSGGSCRCTVCDMARDYDIRTGEDGREGVFEHVYFKNPERLLANAEEKNGANATVPIGIAVFNYS